MNNQSKALEWIFDNCDVPITARVVDGELSRLRAIEGRVIAYEREMDKLQAKHKSEILQAKDRLAEIQNACRHELKTFHADAAGGSDSYYRCDICDKDLGK